MLDQKTRDKISVLGSKYMKELSKYVDPKNLPASMGGENPKEVFDAVGPWTNYVKAAYEQKSYFPDGVVQGDPFKEPARAAKGYVADQG